MKNCEACGAEIDSHFRLCLRCNENGIVWAAKMALQAERGRKEFDDKMRVAAIVEQSGGGSAIWGNITLVVDPKMVELAGNPIDVTPNVLDSNVEELTLKQANESHELPSVGMSHAPDGLPLLSPDGQPTYIANPFMKGQRDW